MVVSLGRPIARLTEPALLVTDEAHHVVSPIWQMIMQRWPGAKLLGVTATSERLDGRGLGECFDVMIIGPSVRELIARDYLAAFNYLAPPTQIDLSCVRSARGDYRVDDLAAVFDQPSITGDCIKHYQRHLTGRSAITFCATVAHTEHVAASFRAAGIAAASIDGGMKREARDELLDDLRFGTLLILASCDLISEGFDAPSIGGAILLRPTQSLALYLQQVGRCLRPKPDGGPAIILDHVGNVAVHGMPDVVHRWSLDARSRRARRTASAVALGAGGGRDAPAEADGELEELSATPAWADGLDLRDPRPGTQRMLLDRAGSNEARLRLIQQFRGYKRGWLWHALHEAAERRQQL